MVTRWVSLFLMGSATLAGLAGLATIANAQTTSYKAPRVEAPADKPDWSGVWNASEKFHNLLDPSIANNPVNQGKPMEGMRDFPPYNAEWEAKYDQSLADKFSGKSVGKGGRSCAPVGMPIAMALYPMEFVVLKDRVLILLELNSQVRRIYTDGRKHPAAEDLDPTSYNGDSIGHWEGDTLIVDTVGIRGDRAFDLTGARHSDQMHIVERIRRISPTQMQDQMTIMDPVAFSKPWQFTRTYNLKPTWHIAEYVCEENNPTTAGPTVAAGK